MIYPFIIIFIVTLLSDCVISLKWRHCPWLWQSTIQKQWWLTRERIFVSGHRCHAGLTWPAYDQYLRSSNNNRRFTKYLRILEDQSQRQKRQSMHIQQSSTCVFQQLLKKKLICTISETSFRMSCYGNSWYISSCRKVYRL